MNTLVIIDIHTDVAGHVFMLLRCFLDEELYQLSIKQELPQTYAVSTSACRKNCVGCLKLKYDTLQLYTLRGSRLSFPWKGGVDGREISEFAGGGRSEVILQIKFKKFAFSRVTHLLDPRIHAIFYIILYNLFIGIYINSFFRHLM